MIKEVFFKKYPEHDYSFYEFMMDAFLLDEETRWIFYKGKTLHQGKMGIFEAVDYLRFDLLGKIEEMEKRIPDYGTFKAYWGTMKDEKRHAVLFLQESSREKNKFFRNVFSKKSIAFYIDKLGVSIFDAVRIAEVFLGEQIHYYSLGQVESLPNE